MRPGHLAAPTPADARRPLLLWLVLALTMLTLPLAARASDAEVQTTWRLLDYIAVDYSGAVSGGKVISAAEYAEMTVFAGQVETRIQTLAPGSARTDLLRRSAALRRPAGEGMGPPRRCHG